MDIINDVGNISLGHVIIAVGVAILIYTLKKRSDTIDKKIDPIDLEVALRHFEDDLDKKYVQEKFLNERVKDVLEKFASIDGKFNKLEKSLEEIKSFNNKHSNDSMDFIKKVDTKLDDLLKGG